MDRNEAISREEAVRTISRIAGGSVSYAEDLYDSFFPKPVVPQCVADWYEEHKDEFEINLFQCIGEAVESYDKGSSSKFEDWLMSDDIDVLTILINMHQFGYEVEEEKRYYVRFKGMESGDFNYLNFIKSQHAWVLSSIKLDENFCTEHTKKQLEEAGFGWVFSCPGVEVKEVTDE